MANGEGFHIDLDLDKYTGGHADPYIHNEYVLDFKLLSLVFNLLTLFQRQTKPRRTNPQNTN